MTSNDIFKDGALYSAKSEIVQAGPAVSNSVCCMDWDSNHHAQRTFSSLKYPHLERVSFALPSPDLFITL